ncbi:hypothetical protein CDAR_457751, partial [Caerostris darwini]
VGLLDGIAGVDWIICVVKDLNFRKDILL